MTDTSKLTTDDDHPETEDPKGQPQHDYLPDGTPVEDEDEAGPGIAIDDDSVPRARGPETEHS